MPTIPNAASEVAAIEAETSSSMGNLLGLEAGSFKRNLIPWLSKGGFAILDQGLISGSNFLLSILLARWLSAEQYGAYAVAFGFFVLLSLVYNCLVLEPMAVFGGSSYHGSLRGYLGSLIWIHVAFSAAIATAFGASTFAAWRMSPGGGLGGALGGVTIASPCVLLFWLARRSFYLELSPAKSALGALVYFGLSLSGMFGLYHWGILSSFSAFVLVGFAALITSFYLLIVLRMELANQPFAHSTKTVWGRHWRYGRWALGGAVASWIPANIYYPLLSSFGGLAHSGQLKALMNLTLPVEQVKMALGLLFIPYAARTLEHEGREGAKSLSRRMTLVSLSVAVGYWAVILIFKGSVFHLLYSGRYSEVTALVPLAAFGSIAWCGSFGSSIALRAMESPASVFAAFSMATVLSLVIGIPAVWRFGVAGAVWGINTSDVLSWILLVWLLQQKVAGRASIIERLPWSKPTARPLAEDLPSQ